jgi:hypothetical protein
LKGEQLRLFPAFIKINDLMKYPAMLIVTIVSLLILFSCQNKTAEALVQPEFGQGPPTIVYKTNGDYSHLVAVTYSETLDKITYFPDPIDFSDDKRSKSPVLLKNEYLLDQLGIGPESVYTSYTIEAYAALNEAPHPDSLHKQIRYKNPFLEMYNCGNRFQYENPEKQINALIAAGELSKRCKKLIP